MTGTGSDEAVKGHGNGKRVESLEKRQRQHSGKTVHGAEKAVARSRKGSDKERQRLHDGRSRHGSDKNMQRQSLNGPGKAVKVKGQRKAATTKGSERQKSGRGSGSPCLDHLRVVQPESMPLLLRRWQHPAAVQCGRPRNTQAPN